jgi:hypothetical protein
MAEDDNFDIDIYGDGGYNGNDQGDYSKDEPELILDAPETTANGTQDGKNDGSNNNTANGHGATNTQAGTQDPSQTTPQQGQKRKEISSEDRPTDPDATTALFVSELSWWTTDDDIRGWIREAGCEDELKDVTFSEHKVNGKSKG